MLLRDIFGKGIRREDSIKDEEGGVLYNLWLTVLPVILGFTVGTLLMSLMAYGLNALTGNNGVTDSAVNGGPSNADTSLQNRGLEEFLASNPFRVSPQKVDTPQPQPKVAEEKPPEPDTSLNEIVLRGTLPGIGAWFDVKNTLKLVLVGKNIDKYKLISVNYSSAVFRKDNDNPITKYIVYGPSQAAAAKPPEPPKQSEPTRPRPHPGQAKQQNGNIIAAVPGSQEGQIPAEMVSNMMQNPFDELKRIRIRPNEKSGGLEVQWIQNDSLLRRLGVQRGDVIKSVNGIPFTNMGDIANSLNSLMNSERFDVEVTRGGKPTALRYVVK